MTIQYRCRCGQEVILRPREGIYLVVGLALGLGLLNTVLLGYLVARSAPAASTLAPVAPNGAEIAAASSPGLPSTVDPPVESAILPDATHVANDSGRDVGDGERRSGAVSAGAAPAATSPTQPAPAVDSTTKTSEVPLSTADSVHLAPPEAAAASGARSNVEEPQHDWAAVDPPSLTGPQMWAFLEAPPADPLDRAAGWLAVLRNGPEVFRVRARDRLAADPATGEFQHLGPRPGSAPADAHPGARIAGRWQQWHRDGGPRAAWSADVGAWVASAEVSAQQSRATVFLVDLSESMSAEVRETVTVLESVVPLLSGPGSHRTWGWIGFRDEVVDRQSLTPDPDAFLASLSRWRCEEGGDVPEGVDRALFEAFRFGSFEWGSGVERVLVVFGDAPPAYERVSGMISLCEAAHSSPDAYRVQVLGILREAEFDRVPSFDELARVGGSRALYVRESSPVANVWWSFLVGSSPISGANRPH